MNNAKPIHTRFGTIPANTPVGCGNSRCHNGWYYWSGSEYPCGACSERAKIEAKRHQEAQNFARNFEANLF